MADGLKYFGEKVRSRLDQMDRRQAWLAEQVGTSPSQLSKWLNDGNQPGHPFLLNLSKVLGVSINYLVDDDQTQVTEHRPLGSDLNSQMIMKFIEILGTDEVLRRIMTSEIKSRPAEGRPART